MTNSKPMPDWLRLRIEAEHPTAFARRNARWTLCKKCDSLVLAGSDAQDCDAGDAICDPAALDEADELRATLAARDTYDLIDETDRLRLRRRTIYTLRAHSPRDNPHRIIPEHWCGEPLGTPINPETLELRTR